ncbi:MAG: NADP-dependent oxidoreductase [Chloroflexota bacterium]
MKAFALLSADEPATIADLPEPDVASDGLLIRVTAASVNGFDIFQASGNLVRMMEHTFPTVIGRDFSGVVDRVGAEWTDVEVGDEVFGFVRSTPPLDVGTFAEILAEGPRLVVAGKPAGVSFIEAAAIPLAGSTAVDAVEAVDPGIGDTILVIGATGGVGLFALQLAAQRGATVIASAKEGDEAELARALGASETIDYATTDAAATVRERYPDGIDAVIDLVDRADTFGRVADLVRDGGRIATTLGAADVEGLAARGVHATNVAGNPTPEKLDSLIAAVAAGTLRVPIQKTFALDEAAAALEAFTAGTLGKIVLVV